MPENSEFVQSLYNLQSFEDFKKEREEKYKKFRKIRLQPLDGATESNDATSTKYTTNSHLKDKATHGGQSHALWEQEHPNLAKWGYLATTVPFVVAASPFLTVAGEAVGTSLVASNMGTLATNVAKTNPREIAAILAALTTPMVYNGIKDVTEGTFTPITALNLSPLAPAVVKVPGVINNLRPLNLRNHWYVSKAPVGYDGIKDALERQFWGILSGKPANIDNPWWFNKSYEKQLQPYAYVPKTVPVAERELYLQQFGEHALKARADAWRMHNRLPQKFGTFTPNPRHPGSFTDIEGIKNLKWIPWPTEGLSLDFVNSVGGNVRTDVTKLGHSIRPDVGFSIQDFGVTTTKDWFDLHPFSRRGDDLYSRVIFPLTRRIRDIALPLKYDKLAINKYLKNYPEEVVDLEMFPTTGLRRRVGNILDKFADLIENHSSKALEPIKRRLSKMEVGLITGGKPFLVLYDIPWTHKTRFTSTSEISNEFLPGFHSENIFPLKVFDWKQMNNMNKNVK